MQRSQREVTAALALSALLVVSLAAPVGAVDARSTGLAQSDGALLSDGLLDDDPLSFLDDPDDLQTSDDGTNFTVSDVTLPSPVGPNQTIGIEATVTNTGNETANQTVGYHFDGETLWSAKLRIEAGDSVALVPTPEQDDPDHPSVVANATLPTDLAAQNYTHGVFTPQDRTNATVDVRTDTAVLEGIVYPAEDLGKRLAGANVTVEAALADAPAVRSLYATTDENGSFAFEYAHAPANYTITVERDGYAATTVRTAESLDGLAPVPVGYRVRQPVALTPLGSIEGTVTDGSNDPVADANVTLADAGGDQTNATTTAENGSYAFADVEPGKYTVTANASGYAGSRTNATVAANETVTADLSIREPANVTIEGLVADDPVESGESLAVDVLLRNAGGVDATETVTLTVDGVGTVANETVSVGAGQRTDITLEWNTASEHEGEYDLSVSTASDTESETVEVGSADGTLVVEPPTDAEWSDDATVRAFDDGEEVANASRNFLGTFDLTLEPGTYLVRVSAPDYRDSTLTDVEIASGETTTRDVTLDPQNGTIGGVVTENASGDAVSTATVRLVGEDETRTVGVHTNGSYTFENVSPGNYTVRVNASQYVPTERNVTVTANETVGADLSLERETVRLSVTPRRPDGHVIGNATIYVVQGGETIANTTADPSGDYELEVPTGDDYAVRATAPGYRDAAKTNVTISAVPVRLLELDLEPLPGSIGGVVTSEATGDPVDTATVRLVGDDSVEDVEVDADGSYAFENVSPGEYDVTADAAEYLANETTVPVDANASLNASFALERATNALEGTIRDEANDEPVANATVTLSDGDEEWSEQTGEAGTYAFDSIPTGEYTLSANASGYAPNDTTGVEIDADGPTTQDVALDRLAVSVSVTDFQGPAETASGEVLTVGANVTNEGERDVHRTIEYEFAGQGRNQTTLGLAPNETEYVSFEYYVSQDPGNYTHGVSSGDDNVTADITVREPANVTIEQLNTTAPVDGGDNLNVTATLVNSGQTDTTENVTLSVDGIGPAGNETVRIGADEQRNVTLVWNTTVEHAGSYDLTVDSKSDTETTTVEIEQATGTVGVSPLNSNSEIISDATVYVLKDGEEIANTSRQHPDIRNYRLEIPVGGNYSVRVTSPRYNAAIENDVGLTKDRSTPVVLKPEPLSGSIDGQVTSNVTDVKLDGVEVRLTGNSSVQTTETNADGSYEFESVEPGTYELQFDPSDYEETTETVVVGPAEGVTANVFADPFPGIVEGTVREEGNRAPIENATVEIDAPGIDETTTDRNGHYRFIGVPAAVTHEITVNASGYVDSNPIDVETGPNAVTEEDITLEPLPEDASYYIQTDELPGSVTTNETYTVEVGVTNFGEQSGNQTVEYRFEGTTVKEETIEIGPRQLRFVTFEVDLPSGFSPGRYSHGFFTEADSRTEELVVAPEDGETIRGSVTDSHTDAPLENATVSIDEAGIDSVQTDANGTYTLTGVPVPSEYTVTISGAPYHETVTKDIDVGLDGAVAANVSLDRPENFAGVDSIDAPGTVDEGETVDVVADVTNYGTTAAGHEIVSLVVDGKPVDNASVNLNAKNATGVVEFEHTADGSGSSTLRVQTDYHALNRTLDVDGGSDNSGGGGGISIGPSPGPTGPDVSVLSAEAAEMSIVAGGTVRVDVTVQNQGGAEGSMELELTADGQTVDSETISVPGGSNVGTTLSGSIDEPGTYELAVAGESAGTLQVDESEDDEVTDGSEIGDGEEVSDGNSTDDGQPGFGLLAAFAALLIGTLYAVGRVDSRLE